MHWFSFTYSNVWMLELDICHLSEKMSYGYPEMITSPDLSSLLAEIALKMLDHL